VKLEDKTLAGRQPAIPCPFCRRAIPINVAALVSGEPVLCAHCGAELSVDRQRSSPALDDLGRLHREAEAAARRGKADEGGSRGDERADAVPAHCGRPRRPRPRR
jgi:hypothetical protein